MTSAQIEQRLAEAVAMLKPKILKAIEIESKKSIQLNFIRQGRPKWKEKFIPDGRAILTGKSGRLQSQINAVIVDSMNKVSIGSNLPYSKIQHEGGKIEVTKKMRSFFWAKFKETGDVKYKILATKKGNTITIPARPFLKIPQEDFARMLRSISEVAKV